MMILPSQIPNIYANSGGFVYNPAILDLHYNPYTSLISDYSLSSLFMNTMQLPMPAPMPMPMPVYNQMPLFGNLLTGTNYSYNSFYRESSSSAVSGSAQKIVQIAQRELAKGVRENGKSNDSMDIRVYKRGAANNNPWCAYFTSYCCEQAGAKPFSYTGSSQSIKSQAQGAGYYAYKNAGYTPKSGDLAVWTNSNSKGHIGVVEKVYADGSFDTIEGNSSNSVKRNHYKSQSSAGSSFNGFVKMNEWLA